MRENLNKMNKDQLIEYIHSLQKIINNKDMGSSDHLMVEFPWAGNLGQWTFYYDKNIVIHNDRKALALGYDPSEVNIIGHEFFTDKLHPDDYDRVMNNMRELLMGKREAYEVRYRIKHKQGHYLWYYDRGVITKREEDGTPSIIQGIVFDITESKIIEEKLRKQATTDELTSAYNRRAFFDQMEDISQQDKEEPVFSLIMYDIDHFKKVNDTYGHLIGDEVLKQLSSLIKENLRKHDEIYRYGGEEFFIKLYDTKLDQAVEIAKRFQTTIRAFEFNEVGNITVSMGVVEKQPGEDIESLVKRADVLVYEAKEAGRNRMKY